MKKTIKIFYPLLILILLISSCKKEKSLQNYLVESQEKSEFISLDVPTSFLELKSDNVSDKVKQTLKSIKKINLVALPIKNTNLATYESEKEKLKNIFSSSKDYKSLMKVKLKGINIKLYYTGNPDSINELIAFGYSKKKGVGVARLLGDKMNPSKIMEMMNSIKINEDKLNLDKLSVFSD